MEDTSILQELKEYIEVWYNLYIKYKTYIKYIVYIVAFIYICLLIDSIKHILNSSDYYLSRINCLLEKIEYNQHRKR